MTGVKRVKEKRGRDIDTEHDRETTRSRSRRFTASLRTHFENLVFFFRDSITLTIYAEFLVLPVSGILLRRLLRGSQLLPPDAAEICLFVFTDALRPFVRNIETLLISVAPAQTLTPSTGRSAPALTPAPGRSSSGCTVVGVALRRSDISQFG